MDDDIELLTLGAQKILEKFCCTPSVMDDDIELLTLGAQNILRKFCCTPCVGGLMCITPCCARVV